MGENNENNTYPAEGEVILIDKDLYWTSFDVVRKVKNVIRNTYKLKKVKVGHAGTLDPLATGLVILCTGKQTRNIQQFQDAEKEYIAEIKLGETTPSYDLETNVDQTFPVEHINRNSVVSVLESFKGLQEQIPPLFSAKNLRGKRAYEYARKGEDIELKPNEIEYYDLQLLQFAPPVLQVRIVCSKGTYIRSFARDLGRALKSGAHLTGLRRTRIGDHTTEQALTINQFVMKTAMTGPAAKGSDNE